MWYKLVSLKASWDLVVMSGVMRKGARLAEWLPPSGEGKVGVICFTLRMLKPKSCRKFDMSSATAR
jgi:hypothetical protein